MIREFLRTVRRALRLPPSRLDHYERGCLLLESGRNEEAIAAFTAALPWWNRQFAAAISARALAFGRIAQTERAIADHQAVLYMYPLDWVLHRNRAQTRLEMRDYNLALTGYNFALTLAPDEHDLLWGRALAWFGLADYERALADFDAALRIASDNTQGQFVEYYRGVCHLQLGDADAALSDLERALRLGFDAAVVYDARGSAWLDKTDYKQALRNFEEAVARDPQRAVYVGNRGLAKYYLGRFDEALADYQVAHQMDSNDPFVYNNRGLLFVKVGEYDRGRKDLLEAARLLPTLPEPHKNLSWLQATCLDQTLRDGQQAVANLMRAFELSGRQPTDWFDIAAAAHAEAGDFEAAVDWQSKALDAATSANREAMQMRLDLFRSGQSYRETPTPLKDSPSP
jgi:tetratricopeptide (TPR) repeat protein